MSTRWRLALATALACVGADTAFGALFRGWSWFTPTVLTVIVIVGVSELVRRSRLPSALAPLVAAAAAALTITAMDAGSVAVLGLFPGAAARSRLAALLHQGATVVHHYAAPVPARTGSVLLAVIGIAAVTLVVDLCVLTLDRAVLAGPPLFAVYVVAAVLTHHGVGWRPFVCLTGGWLLLLAADADETRARWGRHFTDQRGAVGAVSGGIGRRVGGAAVTAAVLLPLIVPGLHAGYTPHHHSDGDQVVTVNPLVSVGADLQHQSQELLFTYSSSLAIPGNLRLTALDVFNGVSFSALELRSTTSQSVTNRSPLRNSTDESTGGNDIRTTISIGRLAAHWAPLPQQASRVEIGDGWLWDPQSSTLWSSKRSTVSLNYTAESSGQVPKAANLETVSFADLHGAGAPAVDLAVPRSVPQSVRQLAARLRRATPYETALAIQNYFLSGKFSYDLNVPADTSTSALTRFLFKTRRGFCQQFATSMAVLARLDGIPTRVAVGFTRGQPEVGREWAVTGADAHAWPELDFPGFGWLEFEPTPRTDGQVGLPGYANRNVGRGIGPGGPNDSKDGNDVPKPKPRPNSGSKAHSNDRTGATSSHGTGHGGGQAGPITLAVLFVLGLAAALPAAARLAGRRRHAHPHGKAAAAHAAWDETRDTVIDLGGEWPEGRSPRQTVTRLLRDRPALRPVGDALERIALAEQQARYAAVVSVDVGPALRADVAAVRETLLARTPRASRIRAIVLPRSMLRRVRLGRPWRPAKIGRSGWQLPGQDRRSDESVERPRVLVDR